MKPIYGAQGGVFSFWIKGSYPGTYGVVFRNATYDRSYVAEYTLDQADTWEHKKLYIPFPSSGNGTWLNGVGMGCQIDFSFHKPESNYATPNTWMSGSYHATTNMVQFGRLDPSGNYVRVTGVQFEPGDQYTGFKYRDYRDEFKLCQRYNERQEIFNVPLVTSGASYAYSTIFFETEKRVSPTLSLKAGYGGYEVWNGGSWVSTTYASPDKGLTSFEIRCQSAYASGLRSRSALTRLNFEAKAEHDHYQHP
jgi:hypothetical protein